ncbi:hypothetical protein QEN19_002484 [Hanseniaspora menglaensis]
MAPFKFGKKKSKTSNGNSSMASTESSNDFANSSRPSISSNNSVNNNNSPEQIFKKNMKSNMLNPQIHINNTQNSNNSQSSHFNGLKFFSSSNDNKNHGNDSIGNKKAVSTTPDKFSNNLNENSSPPAPISYQKYRAASSGSTNALNSPFSLQSPSFTIVASKNQNDTNKENQQRKNKVNKIDENSMADISEVSEMASQSTGLWLTEDDLFPLKPWDRIKLPISPFPRYRHSSSNVSITVNNNESGSLENTSISSDIYVIGGLHGQSVYGDTWKLRFTRTKVNNPDILANFDKNEILHKDNKLYKLYCNTSSIKISDQTPPPRVGHASVMCGNAFIVFGGDTHKLNNEGMMDDDLYLFNVNTKKWTIPSPIGKRPQGRYGHKICVVQQNEILTRNVTASTKVYLFGGQFDDKYFNDLYSFDLSSFRKDDAHWENIKPVNFSPPPITNHVMCTFDNKLWVFGGETSQGLLNDIFVYDPLANDWEIIKSIPNKEEDGIPPPMQEHACVVYKNLMCIYGGKDSEENYLNDLWFFNFMTKKWFKFPTQNSDFIEKLKENKVSPNCLKYKPIGRSGHSMTLLQKENKLLIMGGDKFDYNTNVDLNDIFAVKNNTDALSVEENDKNVLGTTVYTFDLTCLKSFIPNVYDIKDVNIDSALDLLDVADDKSASKLNDKGTYEASDEIKAESFSAKNNDTELLNAATHFDDRAESNDNINTFEITDTSLEKNIIDNSMKDQKDDENMEKIPKESTIHVNRNSFPLLSQIRDQPLVTPTEIGFAVNNPSDFKDTQGDILSNSNPSNKENNGGVSDFFDTYNDDESSIHLRNSMTSGNLLVNAIKNTNENNAINRNTVDDESFFSEKHVELSDVTSGILHFDDSANDPQVSSTFDNELHVAVSENSTATQSHLEKNPIFDQVLDAGSSNTITDEQPPDIKDQDSLLHEINSEFDDNIIKPNSSIDVGSTQLEKSFAVTKTEEATVSDLSKHETISVSEKNFILEEIIKLKDETIRAANQTSKYIVELEKEINTLKRENSKLRDEHDYLNVQIDELNLKNMELINESTNHGESKKQIFTALKLALSQIEKSHL